VVDVWDQVARYLAAVAAGELTGWADLLVTLNPELEAIARNAPIGRLRNDADVRRDVVTAVIAKLHADDHRVIKKLVASTDPPPLHAWFRLLVQRAAIDVMRGRPEFVRGGAGREPGWLSLATLVTAHGAEGASSLVAKRREVEQFIQRSVQEARDAVARFGDDAATNLAATMGVAVVHARRLVKRADAYESVLALILAGHNVSEVAERLGHTRREIELVVEYIEALCHAHGFSA
jgi:hypothetical protein